MTYTAETWQYFFEICHMASTETLPPPSDGPHIRHGGFGRTAPSVASDEKSTTAQPED